MNSMGLIDRLEANLGVVRALAHGVTHGQAIWKPAPEAWSILEVISHLLDEEREDFRVRLDLLLRDPGQDWPPIDPQRWVTERTYAKRDLHLTLEALADERSTSVRWLRGLIRPRWENAKSHASAGHLRCGDLLAAWAAHDLLHVRQLSRLHWAYVQELADPYTTEYAGVWQRSMRTHQDDAPADREGLAS